MLLTFSHQQRTSEVGHSLRNSNDRVGFRLCLRGVDAVKPRYSLPRLTSTNFRQLGVLWPSTEALPRRQRLGIQSVVLCRRSGGLLCALGEEGRGGLEVHYAK